MTTLYKSEPDRLKPWVPGENALRCMVTPLDIEAINLLLPKTNQCMITNQGGRMAIPTHVKTALLDLQTKAAGITNRYLSSMVGRHE